jgi:hypothetical protein
MQNAKAGATQATASYDLAMAQHMVAKGQWPSSDLSRQTARMVRRGLLLQARDDEARNEKRIGLPVPYDPSRMVHTFWDIGMDDENCIWFYQGDGVKAPPDRFLCQLR